jgi:hypothetical protein
VLVEDALELFERRRRSDEGQHRVDALGDLRDERLRELLGHRHEVAEVIFDALDLVPALDDQPRPLLRDLRALSGLDDDLSFVTELHDERGGCDVAEAGHGQSSRLVRREEASATGSRGRAECAR